MKRFNEKKIGKLIEIVDAWSTEVGLRNTVTHRVAINTFPKLSSTRNFKDFFQNYKKINRTGFFKCFNY